MAAFKLGPVRSATVYLNIGYCDPRRSKVFLVARQERVTQTQSHSFPGEVTGRAWKARAHLELDAGIRI